MAERESNAVESLFLFCSKSGSVHLITDCLEGFHSCAPRTQGMFSHVEVCLVHSVAASAT